MFSYSLLTARGIAPTFSGNPPPEGVIPLSYTDARYSENTTGSYYGVGNPITSTITFNNNDWDDSPTYSDGDECIRNYAEGTSVVTLNQCRIRWREGMRVATAAGAVTEFNECFTEVIGTELTDHADGVQNFGTLGTTKAINSTFRCYSDSEAKTHLSNANAVGSDAFRWADNSSGTVFMQNVLVLGGGRGITIAADTGTTNISFENVYIVEVDDGFPSAEFYALRVSNGSGNRVINKWTNVCFATIVDGEIIPGTQIPAPPDNDGEIHRIYGGVATWR